MAGNAGQLGMAVDELRLRRFARLAAPLLRGQAAQGVRPRAARNRAGAGLEFLDLHRYAPGEDVRHIDWRHSARRRQLLVRRYRDEAASDWLLAIDGSASMSRGDKWVFTATLATALAYALLYAGHRVSVAVFADRVHAWCPPGRGRRQFRALSRQLAQYRPAASGGASKPGLCAQRASRTGNAVLMSDFLRDDAMFDDLRLLRGSVSAASAIQVLDDTDAAIDASGDAVLYDIESAAERRVMIDTASATAAARALQDHVTKLRHACASLDVRISTCRTVDAWDRALLAHLGA